MKENSNGSVTPHTKAHKAPESRMPAAAYWLMNTLAMNLYALNCLG